MDAYSVFIAVRGLFYEIKRNSEISIEDFEIDEYRRIHQIKFSKCIEALNEHLKYYISYNALCNSTLSYATFGSNSGYKEIYSFFISESSNGEKCLQRWFKSKKLTQWNSGDIKWNGPGLDFYVE